MSCGDACNLPRFMKSLKAISLAALLASPLFPILQAQDYGLWVKPGTGSWSEAKDGGVAGTMGQRLVTDAFKMAGLSFPADFRPHASGRGWMEWTPCDGRACSSRGKSFEAIQFRFPNGLPTGVRLYGRVYLGGRGWQKTVLIQDLAVLGATGLSVQLEAIQLRMTEGESGRDGDLVRTADEQFNRLLPPGNPVPPETPFGYSPMESGLGRWTWNNSGKEFSLEPGGIATQPGRKGKWTLEAAAATTKTYRIVWDNENGTTSHDTMTVAWDGHLMSGVGDGGMILKAYRVDGLSQLRSPQNESAKKRIAELEWKQESLILPKVALDQVEFGAAVDYFRLQCLKEDKGEEDTKRRGFNVVVAEPRDFQPPKITLNLENIHAGKVLQEIAGQAGLIVQTEGFALVLKSKDEPYRVPIVPAGMVKTAEELIIPVVDLEGSTLEASVDFLKRRSAELTGDGKAPDIRIVEGANPAAVVKELQLRNVPLSEAVRFLAAVTAQPLITSEEMLILGIPRRLPLPPLTPAPAPASAAKPDAAPVPKVESQQPVGGNRVDPVVGVWAWQGGAPTFILESDGSLTCPGRPGRWTRKNPGVLPGEYLAEWRDGSVANYTLNSLGTELTGRNKRGDALRMTRVGPPAPDAHPDSLRADEDGFRSWTDAATARTFRGKLMDKKADGSSALIARPGNAKSVWLDAGKLSAADQFYIRYWIRASEQVKAGLTAHGRPGWKRVKATIKAGIEPLVVTVTGQIPPPHPQIAGLPRPPFTRLVATGETMEFEFASGTDYVVEATARGKVVCRQEDTEKEGL